MYTQLIDIAKNSAAHPETGEVGISDSEWDRLSTQKPEKIIKILENTYDHLSKNDQSIIIR